MKDTVHGTSMVESISGTQMTTSYQNPDDTFVSGSFGIGLAF